MLQNFSQICDSALVIKGPILLRWTFEQHGYHHTVHEIFRPNINYPYENMFAVENNILAFVKGKALYVIPATSNVMKIMEKEISFIVENKIAVPFAHNEEPVDSKLDNDWIILRAKAKLNQL